MGIQTSPLLYTCCREPKSQSSIIIAYAYCLVPISRKLNNIEWINHYYYYYYYYYSNIGISCWTRVPTFECWCLNIGHLFKHRHSNILWIGGCRRIGTFIRSHKFGWLGWLHSRLKAKNSWTIKWREKKKNGGSVVRHKDGHMGCGHGGGGHSG